MIYTDDGSWIMHPPCGSREVTLIQPCAKCLSCGSRNVVLALTANGFGSWMCGACGEHGSYPPSELQP